MNNLRSLDQLIADVGCADPGSQSAGPCGLLIEHLRAARSSLLGSMPGEYRSSLQEAKASVTCISNKNTQTEVKQRLESLLGTG